MMQTVALSVCSFFYGNVYLVEKTETCIINQRKTARSVLVTVDISHKLKPRHECKASALSAELTGQLAKTY